MGWYDWVNDKATGAADFMKLREEFLRSARGKTLEVGFGTGHNAAFYDPAKVESVIGLEPSGGAEKHARQAHGRGARPDGVEAGLGR